MSLDFSANGQQFAPRVAYTEAMLAAEGSPGAQPLTIPERTFPMMIRFSLGEGGRARLEYKGESLSVKDRTYLGRYSIDVFDGKIRKSFIGEGAVKFPSAHISKGGAAAVAQDRRVAPVLLPYRAVDGPLAQFDKAKVVLTDEKSQVNGRECIVLRVGESAIWADPEFDFVPARYHEYSRGKLRQTVDIKYRRDGKYGVVPTSWTNAIFAASGQLQSSVTAVVTEFSVGEQLSDDLFDIPLPDGTWVQNNVTDETHILRKGGQKREVLPGEFDGNNYEQLLHTDPPGKARRWLALVLVGVAAVLVTLVALRRRSRTPSPPPT